MSKIVNDDAPLVADVSVHNGMIDWGYFKSTGAGAIIRCGYGDDYSYQDDKRWDANAKGAIRFGVPFGVYIYSYAQRMEQIESEARHVLRCLDSQAITPDMLSFPVFLDLEEWWEDKKKTVPTWQRKNALEAANRFSGILVENGYQVGVYASLEAWKATSLSTYDRGWKWVAAWRKDLDYPCDLWQYTSDGRINGINGRVDLSKVYAEIYVPTIPFSPPHNVDRDIDALAIDVINGIYGDGEVRKDFLSDNYQQVQNRVNQYYDVARRVYIGDFGNQPHRKPAIEALGYDYDIVQKIVNVVYY